MWDPDARMRTVSGPRRRTSVAGELGLTWLMTVIVTTIGESEGVEARKVKL